MGEGWELEAESAQAEPERLEQCVTHLRMKNTLSLPQSAVIHRWAGLRENQHHGPGSAFFLWVILFFKERVLSGLCLSPTSVHSFLPVTALGT